MSPPTRELGHSIVGEVFPTMHGTTLNGRRVTLPEDVRGKLAFLVLGFRYDARFDVEAWERVFVERFDQDPRVTALVVPVIEGVYRLFAPMIDSGMRRGTPPSQRDRVVTVYTMGNRLRSALGAGSASDIWLYLLDRDGRVLFQYGGPFDHSQFEDMALKLERAL